MTTKDKFTFKMNYLNLSMPDCYFIVSRYNTNNNLYLSIENKDEGPIATCTVNINPLPDDRIAIKNYSESVGMDSFLMELGILDKLVDHMSSGFVTVPVYTLSESGKELFKGV